MPALENAVQTLATALDSLEAKLEGQKHSINNANDTMDQAKRHARIARAQTNKATSEISQSIDDLQGMIADLRAANKAPASHK